MDFTAAHDIASSLEDAIGEELGEDVEVESHIEPLHIDGLAGEQLPPDGHSRIEALLKELAQGAGKLADVHDVRARHNEHGLFVTFHCRVAGAETVETVHDAVDALEIALKKRMPEVRRVIAHAEPFKRGG
jgi:divalent metal cation (Fe/Co/Zn/Cd) transporter